MNKQDNKQPNYYPKSISEAYDLIVKALLSEDKELVAKTWKFINEAEGDWVWVRAKLITDCYESADTQGREEFCLLALDEHVKNGRALPLAEIFIDSDTGIEYLEFLMGDLTIYRVPIATDGMGKYEYQKALEKKFLGDFIETHSVDEITYTPLDTQEKIDAYNSGEYYEKYAYGKRRKNKNDELL